MTVDLSAGAAADVWANWHDIPWRAAHQIVRRLQARIVKATKEGKWGRVQALQHLLTHSFSGKAVAVKRVTENQGKNTPGVDGFTANTPSGKWMLLHDLKRRGYKPMPLRRVYIPKSNGKMRPLGIPTIKDRAMQALHLLALDPVSETLADLNSYGFRKERSCADAMAQCFIVLASGNRAPWILEGDIKACFDQISHDWLLAHIPMDKVILKKWLKAGYMDKSVLHPTEDGTPQGGIISPVLANMALDGLEQVLREKWPHTSFRAKKGKNKRVNFVRYADDFIITGISKELLEDEVKPLVVDFMKERGLELSKEKTVITSIADGFDFLGQNVRKYNGTLLLRPSKKNVKTFCANIRRFVKNSPQATAYGLISQLNPKIRGWASFHRHASSKETFARVDHHIHKILRRWAARRHPTKSRSWVDHRYFCTVGSRNWGFIGQSMDSDGKQVRNCLCLAAATSIVRHVKLKGACNPYDPAWEEYLEARIGRKMTLSLGGRRRLSYLWREQRGICPVCDQPITTDTGWHAHHIIHKTHGGSDTLDNQVLLHPNCHSQVHVKGLSVSKPRSLTRALHHA